MMSFDKVKTFTNNLGPLFGHDASKQGLYDNVITSKPNSKISQDGVAESKYHMCTYIKYFSNLSKDKA